jgi:hypothetical protein
MKKSLWVAMVAFCVVVVLPQIGYSFTILSPNAGYGFQFFGAEPTETGTPFWAGNSADSGSGANMGFWLRNTGAFAAIANDNSPAVPLANAQYYGSAAGLANPSFYFQDGTADALYNYKWAGDTTNFGWYNTDALGNPLSVDGFGNPTLTNGIFTAGTVNDTSTKAVGNYFGLWAKDNVTGDVWYTQSQYNHGSNNVSKDAALQHFAIMRNSANPLLLFIGIEDRPINSSDKDFNDKIVSMNPVPLPGAVLLLGAGMARLAAYARRRREE